MGRIVRDFCRAELRGVLPLLVGMALLMGYLITTAGLRAEAALALPLIAVLALLRAWRQAARFREAFESLPPARRERIVRDYAAPHLCIPVYQGELHLLPDCLVCRSRRTLRLFLPETLGFAEVHRYSGRNRMVLGLRLTSAGGASVCVELVGRQRGRFPEAEAWLAAKNVPFAP